MEFLPNQNRGNSVEIPREITQNQNRGTFRGISTEISTVLILWNFKRKFHGFLSVEFSVGNSTRNSTDLSLCQFHGKFRFVLEFLDSAGLYLKNYVYDQ